MRYITGIHALNLQIEPDTTGDWHQSSIQWAAPTMMDSEDSPLGDWGIVADAPCWIPEHEGESFNVAKHMRACVDLLVMGKFLIAQDMRKDFLDGDEHNDELFEHIYELKALPQWDSIQDFMKRTYRLQWVDFLKEKERG